MPCNGCGCEFGVFKKEHGCKNCEFAFCGACVSKKAVIPKTGVSKSVCNRCFDLITGKKSTNVDVAKFSPPAALQKRLDALQDGKNRFATGQSRSLSCDKDAEIAMRLEKLRSERMGRIPSEQELEQRLARLKGIDGGLAQASTFLPPVDNRTPAEKTNDLLQQTKEELELDVKRSRNDDKEIATRLAKLRYDDEPLNDLNRPGCGDSSTHISGIQAESTAGYFASPGIASKPLDLLNNLYRDNGGASNTGDSDPRIDEVQQLLNAATRESKLDAHKAMEELAADGELRRKLAEIKANQNRKSKPFEENEDDEEEDDDKLTDKLIGKLLAEDALDAACPISNISTKSSGQREKKVINSPDSDTSNSEELPWCNICTEDAVLRCHDCDEELYCNRCFRECHDSFELKDHTTTKYHPPKER